MSHIPFSSHPQRLSVRAKTPLSATQTVVLLLLLGAGATAAWLPPQTRSRLVQPLVSIRQATVRFAQSAEIPFTPSQDKLPSVATTNSQETPRVLLASAPTQTKAIRPRAVTLTINSTGDGADGTPGDGICQTASAQGAACTLRAAIQESNASNGSTINFNIPGAGVKTIAPATALPSIIKPVTINGYSQPGASANTLTTGDDAKILIEINGTNAGTFTLFLATGSDGSLISGLAINRGSVGIGIDESDSNTIQGCFLGTNPTGTTAQVNRFNGVNILTSDDNTIGGTTPASRNLISGNGTVGGSTGFYPGIAVLGGCSNNKFQNNYLGTNAAGTSAIPNGFSGFQLHSQNDDDVSTTGNLISGNLISGNGGNVAPGVYIDGPQTLNTTIQGNKIGTDVTGTKAIPNGLGGIILDGVSNSIIGGTGSGQGNLISGNTTSGIALRNGSNSNSVQGNLIGTNAAGTAALPNTINGLGIATSSNNTIGGPTIAARNIISGNGTQQTFPGVVVGAGATNNTFQNNFIGTDITGTKAIGNKGSGVELVTQSFDTSNTSGNIFTSNVISGNGPGGFAGIELDGTRVVNTTLQSNLIGTDATGNKALANGGGGVKIAGSPNNIVRGNTISSNASTGILISDVGSVGTIIQSNNIGVGSDGTTALGNNGDGILFSGASPGHTVGNPILLQGGARPRVTANGLGNIIANNTGAGVSIVLATAGACHRKSILGNSIYNNGGLAIDLKGDGVTTNQPSSNQGDSTVGPNALQNYPILDPNTTRSGSNVTIKGSLTSAPNATFRIEFYSSPTADSSGFGEGKTFLGFQNVTTPASGTVNFSATLPITNTDTKFSATATDAVGNTSEFSATSTGPTATATPGPTATVGPTGTPRPTNTPGPTSTPVATSTPGPTATPKPTSTPKPTATPGPTSTPTPRPTATATPRPTSTPRPTATPLPTATPAPSLSVNDVSVTEGNSGTKNATFSVTLSGTINSVVSVHYATSNGTATAGSDYTARSGTLTFGAPANARGKGLRALTQTVSVPIIGDAIREADETFFLTLSNPTGATVSRNRGMGTISNDDLVADLSVTQSASAPSVTTGSLATFTITVRNNGPDTAPNVILTDGLPSNATFVSSTPNPTSQSNGTLTFGIGTLASGATRTISIVVRAPSSQSTLANSATVAGSGAADPSAPNNGSSASVNVTTGAPAFTFVLGKLINVGPYSPSLYHPGAHFIQDVTITNTGTAPSSAPLQLVLNGLPSTVTLVNGNGTTGGVPYIIIPNALTVGQSTTVRLEFRLLRSDRPLFTPQIIGVT